MCKISKKNVRIIYIKNVIKGGCQPDKVAPHTAFQRHKNQVCQCGELSIKRLLSTKPASNRLGECPHHDKDSLDGIWSAAE